MLEMEDFKGIREIALIIAYDNGMVNRFEPEAKFIENCEQIISDRNQFATIDIIDLDMWIKTLSDEDKETLAAGEHTDVMAIEARAPKPEVCHELFLRIFEEG